MGESKEVSKEAVKKVPMSTWILVMIVIVLVNMLIVLLQHFLPYPWTGGGISVGPGGGGLMATPLPYVFSLIMVFLIGYGIIKIERTKMALLYLAVMVGTWYSCFTGYYNIISFMISIRTSTAEIHGYALPSFWFPSVEAVRGSFYHGSLGNLFSTYASEWTATILTHMWYYFAVVFFLFGLALILRRLWIDVEALPFPHAQGWIVAEIALEKEPTRRRRFFLIAALLGLLFFAPYMVYTANPAIPDPYGWVKNPFFTTWSTGNLELTEAYPAIKAAVAAPLSIGTDPLRYAYWFLVPIDSLLSFTIAMLGIEILLPQILSYFGYYSGIYTAGIWDKWSMIHNGPPLYVSTIEAGMLLGIVVFMILVNWRYFLGTLRSTLGGKTPSGEVSYVLAYLIFIIGSIALIALFITSAVEPLDAMLGYFIIIVQLVAMIRTRAYAGSFSAARSAHYLKPFWGDTIPAAPALSAGKLFISSHTYTWGTGVDVDGPYNVTLGGALDSFKVASMAGIDAKTAFKLLFVGAIISIIVVIPLTYIVWHNFGVMELPSPKEWDYFWEGDAGSYNSRTSIATPSGVVGFVLCGVLVFLRSRYTWWPIEPLGFVLALDDYDHWWAMTLLPMIVLVIKYIVIRVGGRKVFEEIGVPVAFGVITGEILGIIICGTIGIVKMIRLFG